MINYESTNYRPENLSIFDLANMERIFAEPIHYDWFAAHLLRLCRKADTENMRKLAKVFPDIVAAYLFYSIGHIPEGIRDAIENPEYYEYWIPKLMGKVKVK